MAAVSGGGLDASHDVVAPAPVGAFNFLLHYVRRHLSRSAAVLVAVMGGALCGVAAQFLLKVLIDGMTAAAPSSPGADRTAVFADLGAFLGLLALESTCWRFGGWLGSRAVIKLTEDIRLDLFESVCGRSWDFFNGQASGALAGRVTAAATAASSLLRTVVWNIIPPLTDLVGSVVVLSLIDWRFALGLVLVAIAATWWLHKVGQRGFPLHQGYHREAAEVSGNLSDVLSNVALVRAYGGCGRERERFRQQMAVEGVAHSRSWMFLERLRGQHDLTFWVATTAVLFTAVWEWSRGDITTGGVVVASALTLRILSGSRELGLSLLGLAQQLSAVTEAVEVLRAPAGDDDARTGRSRLDATAGEIELKGVEYRLDAGRPLFADFDLYVPPGQRVGIVGVSGAGKSTLLRLVQGVVAPHAGEVRLDGQRLDAVAGDSLPDAFSVVTQEVLLFHRSVADNLRYGRPDASWDEVLEVSREVGCDKFIRALPQGYDTVVGERGIRLSGGQRQRVAIARALLRRAPVLLLDEATSALDSHAELQVQRALLRLAGGRTVLAVAHRLSTVMDFDRVIVLQEGRVVEDGPPQDLRHGTGPFASTWRVQQGVARTAELV